MLEPHPLLSHKQKTPSSSLRTLFNLIFFINRYTGKLSLNPQCFRSSAIFHQGSIVFINKIAHTALAYFFLITITKYIGIEAWGTYSLCNALLIILTIPCTLGSDRVLMKHTAILHTQDDFGSIKTLWKQSLLLSVSATVAITSATCLALSFICENLFNNTLGEESLFFITLLLLPIIVIRMNSSLLRGIKSFLLSQFFQLSFHYLIAISLLFYVLSSDTFISSLLPIQVVGFGLIAAMICSTAIVIRILRNSELTHIKRLPTRYFLSMSIPLMISGALMYTLSQFDVLMIGYYLSVRDVGLYNGVVKIAATADFFIFTVVTIFAPRISAAFHIHKIVGLKRVIFKSKWIPVITTVPIVCALYLLRMPLLTYFEFYSPESEQVFCLFLAFKILWSFTCLATEVLAMTGEQNTSLLILLFSVSCNFLLNIILIPSQGILGAAIATIASLSAWVIISAYSVWHRHGVSVVACVG